MGDSLMLQEPDVERIELLRIRIGASSKIAVIRAALDILERDTERTARVARWEQAVVAAAPSSRRALVDFRKHSRHDNAG